MKRITVATVLGLAVGEAIVAGLADPSPILNVAILVVTTFVPVAAYTTFKGWAFARRYWPMKLPTLLAVGSNIAMLAAAWFAYATISRQMGNPINPDLQWLNIVLILGLLIIPVTNVAYLIWLDQRRSVNKRDRRISEPELKGGPQP